MCGPSGASSGGTPPEDSSIEVAFGLYSDRLMQRSTATRTARPVHNLVEEGALINKMYGSSGGSGGRIPSKWVVNLLGSGMQTQ